MRELGALIAGLAVLTFWVSANVPVREPSAPAPVAPEPADAAARAHTPDAPGTVRLHDASLRIASAARARLEQRDRSFRNDCSGYVASALDEAGVLERLGVARDATVAVFYAEAEARGAVHHDPVPAIGDLAFFDNTWDRDGDGKMDDHRTHIAVVVDVEPDGTVVMAHKGSDYRLIRMNLLHPMDRESPDGVEWNSWLRRTGDRGNPLGMYLTGTLWSGFASLDLEAG
ncbi:MAG: hypothetical protein KC656_07230 [Myxococcales bacterium]|nr:hypothetical protein [Myxococcales bacterium]MCB9671096.1 hypothetical protein [Alphaproteobacteria bacterium]MCB9692352.1 hypothetical protein [Alphaproteobacteria bacterium]